MEKLDNDDDDDFAVDGVGGGVTNDAANFTCNQLSEELSKISDDKQQPQPPLPSIPSSTTTSIVISPKANDSSNGTVSNDPTLAPPQHRVTPNTAESTSTRVQLQNPWDFVPDQPNNNNKTSSPGFVSAFGGNANINPQQPPPQRLNKVVMMVDNDSAVKNEDPFESGNKAQVDFWSAPGDSGCSTRILEDPFDADWATLATAKTSSSSKTSSSFNPFAASEMRSAEGGGGPPPITWDT